MVSTAAFLELPAVDLCIGGRYSLASRYDARGSRREFACRTTRISPFHLLVDAPVPGPVGERVISYFNDFGCLDGWICDSAPNGFLVSVELQRNKREKFAKQLAWLEKKQRNAALVDDRQQPRIIPRNPHSILIFADGTTLDCFVIDISSSGVAVSADVEPSIGTRLAVGRSVGHVIRTFPEGFAVQFDRAREIADLEQLLRPPTDILAYKPAPLLQLPLSASGSSREQDVFLVD